jgi:hypothetical protein
VAGPAGAGKKGCVGVLVLVAGLVGLAAEALRSL